MHIVTLIAPDRLDPAFAEALRHAWGGGAATWLHPAKAMEFPVEDAPANRHEVRDEAERADLRRTLGVADGAALPPAVRSQVTALEDEQKRRATRSLRDGIDRVLTDLQSMYRDVVMLAFEREADMINRELESELRALAQTWGPRRALVVLDRIAETRRNLEQNVNPTLALESLLVTVASGRTP